MKVMQTQYPAEDIVVADFNVAHFGAVADGKADATEPVQNALNAAGQSGGGVVFVPAGKYKITGTLLVPTGVTLRGDRSYSWTGGAVEGTILEAYAGRGEENGDSFIQLKQASGVTILSVWYPEQRLDQPFVYPWTIEQLSGDCATVENVTLVNAYNGSSKDATKFGDLYLLVGDFAKIQVKSAVKAIVTAAQQRTVTLIDIARNFLNLLIDNVAKSTLNAQLKGIIPQK